MHTVRQRHRTLYRQATQAKGVTFYRLYAKLGREDVLWAAWRQVQANHGAPGVDGDAIEAIGSSGGEGERMSRLGQQRRAKTYRVQPGRRVEIPKPQGGTRPLGSATVEDRVVPTAMQLILEPLFEADCHDGSAG